MSASEKSDGAGAKSNVVSLRGWRAGEAGGKKPVDLALVYFPDGLKRHYMDVLLRYKNELTRTSRKRVGWLAIRDQIMAEEDAVEAEKEGWNDQDKKVNRPRSDLVRLDDFKGWYNPKNNHLPTNIKFQYIDRFIRSLRLDGGLDAIETGASLSEREYLREAILQFYRPHHASTAEYAKFSGDPLELLGRTTYIGITEYKDEPSRLRLGINQIVFILFFHGSGKNVVPVDLLAAFVPAETHLPADWPPRTNNLPTLTENIQQRLITSLPQLDPKTTPIVHLYTGFFIVEAYIEGMVCAAMLHLRSPSNAAPLHLGIRENFERYYSCKLGLHGPTGSSMISWRDLKTDPFIRLALGFGKKFIELPNETFALDHLRAKFSIGYPPC